MKALAIRSLVAFAALAVLGVAAAPAHATLTRVGQRISASSNDAQFDADDGSITRVRCPTVDFTGTIVNTTTISGTITFRRDTRTTCTGDVLGVGNLSSDAVSCRITLRSVGSVAGVSTSFDVAIDTPTVAEPCSVTFPAIGTTVNVDAQTVRGCATFTQATQSLVVNCRLTVTSRSARASRTATFRGNFSIIANPRITVS